jgi:hypothetical protein
LVQGGSGATTSLVTTLPKPPAHQHPGQPKIAAGPDRVDRATLLPKPVAKGDRAASTPLVEAVPAAVPPGTP